MFVMKEVVRDILLKKCLKVSNDKVFLLSSGRYSNFYIDCKPLFSDPKALKVIGTLFFEKIKELDVDAIGGPAMGAVPIAIATSLISCENGKFLKVFWVRKERKDHGISSLVDGDLDSVKKAVLVEDVLTTGGSIERTIASLASFCISFPKVLVLFDREEGGMENLRQLGLSVEALFRRREFLPF